VPGAAASAAGALASSFPLQQAGRAESAALEAWAKAQQQNGFPISNTIIRIVNPRTIS
jgi:hypothetical protein